MGQRKNNPYLLIQNLNIDNYYHFQIMQDFFSLWRFYFAFSRMFYLWVEI